MQRATAGQERGVSILHGITLTERPADWSVLQQEDGRAKVTISGTFRVHPAAIAVGVESAVPCYRVMREDDNMAVIPWTPIQNSICEDTVNFTGHFRNEFYVPTGGPYRLETALKTKSTKPDTTWLYRGDVTMHFLVGDVFIIAGQSNSAGHAWAYCPDPPDLCVHLFRNNGKWDLAAHPMNESTDAGSLPNEEMGIPGICPYLSFGKKYYALTGRPVGLVQTALGGSSISQWSPDHGELYRNMLERCHRAGAHFAGILWYQGCNDATPITAGHYEEDFRRLVEAARRDLGFEIPFYTVQLNRQVDADSDEGWAMVREAQRRAAKDLPSVSVISSTNLPISDGIHNSAAGNLVLGERLAMHVAGRKKLTGCEEFEAPELTRVFEISTEDQHRLAMEDGFWIGLHFSHVRTWFVLYSGKGEESGFTVEDAEGMLRIERVRANLEDGCRMYLKLNRRPGKRIRISFAWQADPVRTPPVDAVTYLPPLSFYRNEFEVGKNDDWERS